MPHCTLLVLFLLLLTACSEIGVGGQCHHQETGEVLTQIRDADGDLFRVRKMPNQPTFTGTYDGCGVPVQAVFEDSGNFFAPWYVVHPETGNNLRVYSSSEQGLRLLVAYEWY